MVDFYEKHLIFAEKRNRILEKYAKELLSQIKKKTGLVIPNRFSDISQYVLFLEDFIHSNKLFDTNPIWSKYEEKLRKLWEEIIEDLPEPVRSILREKLQKF